MSKNILKDQLPLMTAIDYKQMEIARNNNIPLFKGILSERIDDGFGNTILKKISENVVVVGGAILALEKICGATATWKPRTLNEIYSINQDIVADESAVTISLFGVGNGGSGLNFGSVLEKDIKSRNIPSLLPIRSGPELTGVDASRYYFKKDNGDGTFHWYLKELFGSPVIKTCWKDSVDPDAEGTEVLTEIHDSERTEGLETFAEYLIDLNHADVREYYESIAELDMARYNSVGLFTGQKVTLPDESVDYVNIRLFSYINMDNKSVVNKTISQYSYQIYSLV